VILAFLFALLALAASLPFVSDTTAVGAAMKVVGATMAVAILPGALLSLLWRPRAALGLLEWLAISIALSLGLVHLMTTGIIILHVGVPRASVLLLVALAMGCVALLFTRHDAMRVSVGRDDVMGLIVLVVLAVCLYIQGSPVFDWEDQVHVSVVRRLAALDRLTLDNFYLTPHVVYTYPFPSTHAFMAFVTHIGNVDALFVYHKIRFFWGPAAVLMIYVGALAVFGTRMLALTSLLTGAVLTITGVFAVVEGSYWGQLATFSHASDVAMALVFPALLALSYGFIVSEERRERALFCAGSLMLAFTLTVVHVREVVQYLAYLGCFAVIAVLCAPFRTMGRRAFVLLATTLVVAVVFLSWHQHVVRHVADLVDAQRGKLIAVARATSGRNLVLAPAADVLPSFVLWFDAPFHGLTPLLLFAGPIAIVAFRQRPLVWLIAASSVAYLLVMNVPALAIPYIYLTYSEILITPIRNLTPFLYMLAGPILCIVAVWIWTSLRSRVGAVVAVVTGGAVIGVVGSLAPIAANQSEVRFFVPAILAWTATLLYLARPGPLATLTRRRVATFVAIAGLSAVALWPDRTPRHVPPVIVNIRWVAGISDIERIALERRFSLVELQATDDPETRVYDMRNISRNNVKALVTSAAVRDTFHINRTTFEADDAARRPWYGYPNHLLLIVTAAGLWICGFVLPGAVGSRSITAASALEQLSAVPVFRSMVPFALFAIPVFALTFSRTSSPAIPAPVKPFNEIITTPAALLRQIDCVERYNVTPPLAELHSGRTVTLTDVVSCPPDQRVVDWVRTHVPVDAVFAIDRWNVFMPTVFLPQQVVTFSGFEYSLPNENEIYPTYVRRYRDAMQRDGVQPFFNDHETPEQRQAFVRDLAVTHVLVDPQYYGMLRPVLDGLPQMFTRRYDSGRWAVYEVHQE
jgi:hypothetical protein